VIDDEEAARVGVAARPGAKVIESALEVGYESESAFSRAFKHAGLRGHRH
jgi:AraC-like DNA-binding protein